jgi:hypothetical protein
VFKEIHKAIDESAESFVSSLKNPKLSYPPDVELSANETDALSTLDFSKPGSALRKVVADACSYPVFQFFSLMDAVADPETDLGESWLGATLEEKTDDEDEPMLHDELFDSYWLYKKERKS